MKLRFSILLAIGCLVALSFIAAPYPNELVFQHAPTGIGLLILTVAVYFWNISQLSFACVVVFLLLHILGARWIYSYVPYDDWATVLTGTSLSERFGWERNGYDRFVHFASGVLGISPAAEVLQRFGNMRPLGAAIMGIASVLAVGAIYEIIEWQIAILFSPSRAEAYNGQQGDVWDPQKDLACALFGSLIAAVFVLRRDFREQPFEQSQ